MTHLDDEDRSALRTDIHKNLIMCGPDDREFWEALDQAVMDSEALEGALDSITGYQELVAEWKDASGLERGGDPDSVRPGDLRRFIGKLDVVLARVEALETGIGWAISTLPTWTKEEVLRRLRALLASGKGDGG